MLRATVIARRVAGITWAVAALGCETRGSAGADVPVDTVTIQLTAEGTTWQASYQMPKARGGIAAAGHEVHVPLGADVHLALESRDYICTFSLPELGYRDFAAPDLRSEIHFRAERMGTYELRGDESCGAAHPEDARGQLVIEPPAAFRAWVAKHAIASDR